MWLASRRVTHRLIKTRQNRRSLRVRNETVSTRHEHKQPWTSAVNIGANCNFLKVVAALGAKTVSTFCSHADNGKVQQALLYLTTTLGQFQSGVKTILFCLAYGT